MRSGETMSAAMVMGLVVIVVAAVIGAAVVLSGGKYRRLFSPEHYREVAELALALRARGLASLEGGAAADAADPAGMTSAGMVVSLTISLEEGAFTHHFAVSMARQATPHALGDRYLVYLAHVLGLPVGRIAFYSTPSTVHHGRVSLSPDDHDKLAAQTLVVPLGPALNELIEAYNRDPMHCEVIELG